MELFEVLAYQQPTTDPQHLRMIATIFPVIFGAMAFYHTFVQHRKLRRLVRVICDTPTSQIGDVQAGLREVTGQLLAADKELRSPLQGIPCVSWIVGATRQISDGEHTRTKTVVGDSASCDAILRDKTGSLRITMGGFEELESTNEFSVGGDVASSEAIEKFEKKYDQSAKGLTVFEFVMPTRVDYTAVGTVVSEEGHLRLTSGSSDSVSLLSPKPESVIVSEFQAQRLTHRVLLVLIPFVMLSPIGFFVSTKAGLYSLLTTFVVTVSAWVILSAMERRASSTARSKA